MVILRDSVRRGRVIAVSWVDTGDAVEIPSSLAWTPRPPRPSLDLTKDVRGPGLRRRGQVVVGFPADPVEDSELTPPAGASVPGGPTGLRISVALQGKVQTFRLVGWEHFDLADFTDEDVEILQLGAVVDVYNERESGALRAELVEA